MPQQFAGRVASSHEWSDVQFESFAAGNSVVIASIDTYNGGNTAGVRLRNVGADGMELFVEEERSADDETRHVQEDVGFFGTEPGPITDQWETQIGESDVITRDQPDADHWHRIDLDSEYSNPVVFTQVMSYRGEHPSHTRVRNVESDSFEFQIEEWEYLNGPHTEELIGYVVLEAGVHTLDGGIPLEVGTTETTHAWSNVNSTIDAGTDPVFISRSQTFNGPHEIVTRNRRVGEGGAELRVQEEEGRNGPHTDETVGYMLLPRLLSNVTAQRAASTHQWTDVSFSGPRSLDTVVLSSINTFNGRNTADVRMRNVGPGGLELFIEEEQSKDNETNHLEEEIGVFTLGTGPIFDTDGDRVGEAGKRTADQPGAQDWHSVGLDDDYSNPVVFAQLMSYNGADPCHIRLRNVDSDSFEFQIEEWDYLNQQHVEETIGYVVLEAGTHDIAGADLVHVGTTQGDHNWTNVSFDGDLETDPVAISRCQTFNGHNEVVTRNRNVTAEGAELRLQEEQGRDGEHVTETIGFMAAPRTTASVTAGSTRADDDWSTVELSGIPTTDPVIIPSIATFNGGNTVGVRTRNIGSGSMDLFLEEEQSSDEETSHVTEEVGIFATSGGPIHDDDGERIGEAGVVETDQPTADHWHTLSFDGSYADPVVFMHVMSYEGGEPCHTRLRNVDSDSAEYRIEEWDYLNGKHTDEQIGYVVFESGVHKIEGEIPIEAGTTRTDHEFDTVDFTGDLSCDPVFITHCQSHNGPDQVVTRNQNVTAGSGQVRLQEEEGNNDLHVEETVGYLVAPKLVLGNRRSIDEFRPSCHGFSFVNSFDEIPDLPDLPADIDSEIENIDAQYGLCGGMALAARDFFLHDRAVPDDTTAPDSGALFDYLWQRQIDTFDPSNGFKYLRRFVHFYLPTTFTRAKSDEELRSLKAGLDRGIPQVLGLVYVRAGDGNLWDNHQVLAYDYTESGNETTVNVYDPNCPGDNNVTVRVELKDNNAFDFRPGNKHIDAEQYRGGERMENVIGLIHMDVPSQNPPGNL